MGVDKTVLDLLKVLEFRGLLLSGPLCGARPFLVDFDREACRHISDQRPNCRYLLAWPIASPLPTSSPTVGRGVLTIVGEFAERVANSNKGFDLACGE
jgi:hypothetical protein